MKNMKRENKKSLLLITPSRIIAKGIESLVSDYSGEFYISGILSDLSRANASMLKNTGTDIIIIDPVIFDFHDRENGRSIVGELSEATVIALENSSMGEECRKQYDDTFNIYDHPSAIIRKLRNVTRSVHESPAADSHELSAREKEILVCVAKGMLNKEIADLYKISVYTVISHRKNISRKTGIKTVAGLTVYAMLNNLVDSHTFE